MKNLIIIIIAGIILIPILLLALITKKIRITFWYIFNNKTHTYTALPTDKVDQMFSLCVNFLLIVGKKTNMSYNEINIYIFCFIWPVITLLALIF